MKKLVKIALIPLFLVFILALGGILLLVITPTTTSRVVGTVMLILAGLLILLLVRAASVRSKICVASGAWSDDKYNVESWIWQKAGVC